MGYLLDRRWFVFHVEHSVKHSGLKGAPGTDKPDGDFAENAF
jgi:hypothetical protein